MLPTLLNGVTVEGALADPAGDATYCFDALNSDTALDVTLSAQAPVGRSRCSAPVSVGWIRNAGTTPNTPKPGS